MMRSLPWPSCSEDTHMRSITSLHARHFFRRMLAPVPAAGTHWKKERAMEVVVVQGWDTILGATSCSSRHSTTASSIPSQFTATTSASSHSDIDSKSRDMQRHLHSFPGPQRGAALPRPDLGLHLAGATMLRLSAALIDFSCSLWLPPSTRRISAASHMPSWPSIASHHPPGAECPDGKDQHRDLKLASTFPSKAGGCPATSVSLRFPLIPCLLCYCSRLLGVKY